MYRRFRTIWLAGAFSLMAHAASVPLAQTRPEQFLTEKDFRPSETPLERANLEPSAWMLLGTGVVLATTRWIRKAQG